MKIKVTEIECNAEELRQSNTLADSFVNLLRKCFAGTVNRTTDDQEEDDDEGRDVAEARGAEAEAEI